MMSCAKYIPVEFNRKPRKLCDLARWKATEFRMFLMYVGPIVLKNVLPTALYKNYLLFHCAITILSSEKHITEMLNLAHELLIMFIKHSKLVYGLEFLIYNVHILSHLCDDVRIYGKLDNYSAFPFENYLGSLKKLVRTPNKPLQQISKRLAEFESTFYANNDSKNIVSLNIEFDSGPRPDLVKYDCFKKAVFKYFEINVFDYRNSDCYCFTKYDKVIEVHNIMKNVHTNRIDLYCKEFMVYDTYYSYPINSTEINIFTVSKLSNFKIVSMDDIICKCVVIFDDTKDSYISFPIVHTL